MCGLLRLAGVRPAAPVLRVGPLSRAVPVRPGGLQQVRRLFHVVGCLVI
jgi:hypothetical protein